MPAARQFGNRQRWLSCRAVGASVVANINSLIVLALDFFGPCSELADQQVVDVVGAIEQLDGRACTPTPS